MNSAQISLGFTVASASACVLVGVLYLYGLVWRGWKDPDSGAAVFLLVLALNVRVAMENPKSWLLWLWVSFGVLIVGNAIFRRNRILAMAAASGTAWAIATWLRAPVWALLATGFLYAAFTLALITNRVTQIFTTHNTSAS